MMKRLVGVNTVIEFEGKEYRGTDYMMEAGREVGQCIHLKDFDIEIHGVLDSDEDYDLTDFLNYDQAEELELGYEIHKVVAE